MSAGSANGGSESSSDRSHESGPTHAELYVQYKKIFERQRLAREKSQGVLAFDLHFFESVLEHPQCRELTPEDHEAVGMLYESSEIHADIFGTMATGEVATAEAMLEQGGMVDRWNPAPQELAVLRSLNPDYVPSGEEFRAMLEGKHGRSADFRAWGLFGEDHETLEGIAAGFFPPKDEVRKEAYAAEVTSFFRGEHPEIHFNVDPAFRHDIDMLVEHAPTTAEFYMIAARARGAGTVSFEHLLQQAEQEYPEITDWYLLRFGSLRMVLPDNGYHASDAHNAVSKVFFKKRAFGTRGQCYFEHSRDGVSCQQLAARTTREGEVVVVHPTWKVMTGDAAKVRSLSRDEVAVIYERAKTARSQNK